MLDLETEIQAPTMTFDNGHSFEFNRAVELLGNRSKHILQEIGVDNIQGFYDIVMPHFHDDYFLKIRNCGSLANKELCHFKIRVDEIISNFDLYKSRGLFNDLQRSLNTGFLKQVESDIFENHFMFNLSDNSFLSLDELAKRNSLTKERVRQYKVSLLPKLNSLIIKLWRANAGVNSYLPGEFFSVDDEQVMIINDRESVSFSKNFIVFALSCIAEPICEFHPINIKPPSYLGLFINPIPGLQWKALLNDVNNLMDSRRTDDIEFLLINFIPGYFEKDQMYNPEIHHKRIVDVLIHYCDLVSTTKNKVIATEDSLTFLRTTKKKVYEYIVEVLDEQKQPMHFSEIYYEFKKRGIRATSPTALQGAMMNQSNVFGLKGQGIYGLIKWGGYFGTIGDVTEQLLLERNGPIPWIELKDFLARELVISEDSINTVLFFYEGESRFVHKGSNVYLQEWVNKK